MEMQMEFARKLPTPLELKNQFPVSERVKQVKEERDAELADIFEGRSDKLCLIIGPCSADREDAVVDYMNRLAGVYEKVKDKVFIVPRVYTNKPRTIGLGYKGMLHQPDPEKGEDLLEGIIAIREMHQRIANETDFTCADEMLYPENHRYLSDLLSYVAVGARSAEDQQHRIVASGVGVPCGLKNPTSGDLSVMMNSVIAAQNGHRFLYRGWEVQTEGNPRAHAIMRGRVDKFGHNHPNYYYEDLLTVQRLYEEAGAVNPAVIVDTNHRPETRQGLHGRELPRGRLPARRRRCVRSVHHRPLPRLGKDRKTHLRSRGDLVNRRTTMTLKEGKEIAQQKFLELMGEEWVERNARTIFESVKKADNDPDMVVYTLYQALYDGSSPAKELWMRLKAIQEVPANPEHKTVFVLDLKHDRVEIAETY